MSYVVSPPQHPVLTCASSLAVALGEVESVDPLFMTTADKQTALVDLAAVAARLDELRLRVLGAADDVAALHGARDAGAWLAHATRADDAAGRRDLALARDLQRRPLVAAAMRTGRLDRAQAVVITRALDALPDDVPAQTLEQAEAVLVAQGEHFAPRELRRLGRRVLAVVAPEVDEAHERQALEDEEAHAEAVTSLHTRRRGDGTTDIRIRCADAIADRLLAYLTALTSPRRPDQHPGTGESGQAGTGPDDRRPYPQRLGHAFGDLLERMDPSRLPLHGGDATTVIVTIDLQTLLSGLGVALIGDEPITAAQARRLACTAQLIPAVLDSESVILDQGRAQRLYDRHQRKAMAIRDITCRTRGCTIPAAWCEAHHLTPWSHGGKTDLADGVLLCSHHHHRAHDHRYHLTRHPDGDITFHRRT